MAAPRVVLLDRDGVINEDSPDYIRTPADWQPIPGSLEAIAELCAASFAVAVCTNQAGVARGLLSRADLEAIHRRMETEVSRHGGRLAGIFFCPHGPEECCDCRKPAPGLLHQAARALGIDLADVPYIGDSGRDLEAARRAGARPVLVLTGNGRETLEKENPDCEVYDDLARAARAILDGRAERDD